MKDDFLKIKQKHRRFKWEPHALLSLTKCYIDKDIHSYIYGALAQNNPIMSYEKSMRVSMEIMQAQNL